MSTPWTVRCTVASDGTLPADEMAGIVSLTLFDHGAVAVGESTTDVGAIELLAGFASQDDAEQAHRAISAKLPEVEASLRFDKNHLDWVEAQQHGLAPTTIDAWTIRAPWHHPPKDEQRDTAKDEQRDTAKDEQRDIVIDPGAAFGHGAHPSTRLAIELMLRELDEVTSVVDLGTGTGVVAIIAATAGLTVRATEYEADSVAVAHENIERNGVGHLIELIRGDASNSRIDATDLVVANVTMGVHRSICSNYATADRIVVAGLLCSQVAELQSLLPLHTAKTIRTNAEWAGATFLRTTIF